ncbi:zwei Ig domain protein zig-8-like isoform X2 [Saccostrea echinata]|uniref:zwei Ig domain protein zig-8-like isoform X2 n=1 Tax=Saccostrea echinata TaxID=191078 RepID=UPI002A82DA52|nr:zwei Ig domain protein zig-8-like isoform X2 [Saccostrea echinata]
MDGIQFFNGVFLFVLLISALLTKAQFHGFQSSSVRHPSFNPTKRNVTYHVGETALLQCSVENLGTKEVIWKNRNQKHVITVGTFVYIGSGAYSVSHPANSPHYDLVIKNVQRYHAGVFECQVSTREDMSIEVTLNVIDPPVKPTYSSMTLSGTEFVDQGDPIKLSCNATGVKHAPEDVDWFFDGLKIQSSVEEEIVITKFHSPETRTLISTLEIERSKMKHSGIYICRSTDGIIKSHTVQVINATSKNRIRAVVATGGKSDDRRDRHVAEQTDNKCSLLTMYLPTFVLLSTLSSIYIYLPR